MTRVQRVLGNMAAGAAEQGPPSAASAFLNHWPHLPSHPLPHPHSAFERSVATMRNGWSLCRPHTYLIGLRAGYGVGAAGRGFAEAGGGGCGSIGANLL